MNNSRKLGFFMVWDFAAGCHYEYSSVVLRSFPLVFCHFSTGQTAYSCHLFILLCLCNVKNIQQKIIIPFCFRRAEIVCRLGVKWQIPAQIVYDICEYAFIALLFPLILTIGRNISNLFSFCHRFASLLLFWILVVFIALFGAKIALQCTLSCVVFVDFTVAGWCLIIQKIIFMLRVLGS